MKQFIKLTLVYLLGCTSTLNAQVDQAKMHEYLKEPSIASRFNASISVMEFYGLRGFRAVWSDEKLKHQFLAHINQADYLGLNKNDYQPTLLHAIESGAWHPKDLEDSLWEETGLTDAALHFYHDVAHGNTTPAFEYDGLKLLPRNQQLLKFIHHALEADDVSAVLQAVEPVSPAYQHLKAWMNFFQNVISEPGFRDAIVTSVRADSTNIALLRRLHQLSIIDTFSINISTKEIVDAIKSAQWLFNLVPDGVLRSATLAEMNKPLLSRIEILRSALNTTRWLTNVTAAATIVVVNIPSASLLVFENGKVILESKVIVGKKSTPTHTLSSKVTEVILYPYWMVPKKIATRELLPLIKKNIGYLDANAIQVIDLQGKVVNPNSINWGTLSPSYFPYILRQSTGCDNSLGLVKLNFYNPFITYLHDTPWKYLFHMNKRYFSHGCIRVEKANELARLVLKGNEQAIDTVTEKGCLKNQSPVTIRVSTAIPVLVIYQTAWVDATGTVRFEEDIYQKNISRQVNGQMKNKSLVAEE